MSGQAAATATEHADLRAAKTREQAEEASAAVEAPSPETSAGLASGLLQVGGSVNGAPRGGGINATISRQLLRLQASHGNQYVQRLVAQNTATLVPAKPQAQSPPTAETEADAIEAQAEGPGGIALPAPPPGAGDETGGTGRYPPASGENGGDPPTDPAGVPAGRAHHANSMLAAAADGEIDARRDALPAAGQALSEPASGGPKRNKAAGRGAPFLQRQETAEAPAVWNAPIGLGACYDRPEAAVALVDMKRAALELKDAEFEDLDLVAQECETWLTNMSGQEDLTPDEARQLASFGRDFQRKHDAAITQLRTTLESGLEKWRKPPLSEDQVTELRETIHNLFMDNADVDLLAQAEASLKSAKELVDEVNKWVDRASKAKVLIQAATKLEDLKKGLDDISGKLGDLAKLSGLASDIGILAGEFGETPGGLDDVAQFEAGLDIADFIISKSKVPLIGTIWSEYIYKVAKVCLNGIRKIKTMIHDFERETLLRWWEDQSKDIAPSIDTAPVSDLFRQKHFPGGQGMLNFMWDLMLDQVYSVPEAVEDYFVEWKDLFNAGLPEKEQLESDSSVWNLWNVFTREEAPNILGWLKANKESAWTRLYGGLTPPG